MTDTMKVQYNGTSDFQIFDASDMAKAGLQDHGFSKTSFPQGQPVEVPKMVGEALISEEGLFGDYMFKEVNDDGDDSSEPQAGEQSEAGSDEAGQEGQAVSGTPAELQESSSRGTRTSRSTKGSTP